MRTLPGLAIVLATACGGSDGGFFTDAPVSVDARIADAAIDASIDAPLDAAPIPSPNPGFGVPSQETRANQATGGGWFDVGPADWSCLGTPSGEQPSSGTIELTGRVRDLQTGTGLRGADVTARASRMAGEVLGAASTRDDGELTMTLAALPLGDRRYRFRMTAPGYLTTYLVETYLAPGQAHRLDPMMMVSQATATALPAYVGLTRDPARGMLLTTVRDCQGRPVSNAVVALSSFPGTPQHLGDAKTFYFSAGAQSLPVRTTTQPVVNRDGKAMVLEADPALARAAFLQAWGYRTAADLAARNLTLLAEVPVPVEPDVAVYTDAPPFRF